MSMEIKINFLSRCLLNWQHFVVIQATPGYYITTKESSSAGPQIITGLLKDMAPVNVRLAFRGSVFQVHGIPCHVSSYLDAIHSNTTSFHSSTQRLFDCPGVQNLSVHLTPHCVKPLFSSSWYRELLKIKLIPEGSEATGVTVTAPESAQEKQALLLWVGGSL